MLKEVAAQSLLNWNWNLSVNSHNGNETIAVAADDNVSLEEKNLVMKYWAGVFTADEVALKRILTKEIGAEITCNGSTQITQDRSQLVSIIGRISSRIANIKALDLTITKNEGRIIVHFSQTLDLPNNQTLTSKGKQTWTTVRKEDLLKFKNFHANDQTHCY